MGGDLTFIFGLRYDWYTSNDEPALNTHFVERQGYANNHTIDGENLLQPRFGFSWTINPDVTLRGGTFGGYRGCVVVESSRRVTLEDMNFDGWYGQELRSTLAADIGTTRDNFDSYPTHLCKEPFQFPGDLNRQLTSRRDQQDARAGGRS